MFANTPTIDERGGDGGGDDDLTINDDATEISQQSFLPYNGRSFSPTSGRGGGGTGTIRVEGWLNHATESSHADGSSGGRDENPIPQQQQQQTSSTSVLGKAYVSKKKQRQNKNKQPRYFVLRESTLSYYVRRHDVKAKGTFVLTTGCAVGPVVYGSLDDPWSSMEAVAVNDNDNCDELLEGEFPLSPSSGGEGNPASGAEQQQQQHNNNSGKSKKKKRTYYCFRVTWPINNKPSKDEKDIAQAKAQVAAESEKEAMQQQQQQQLEPSAKDNAAGANQNNNPNRSPVHAMRPTASSSRHLRGQPAGPSHRRRVSEGNLPPNLHPPDLNRDPHDNDDGHDRANGGVFREGQLRAAALLPKPHLPVRGSSSGASSARSVAISTPASAMAGMNAFHHPEIDDPNNKNNVENENCDDPGGHASMNHETGLHKHYTQQIEKHAKDQQKATEELQKVMNLLSRKKSHKKTKKKVIQGTKVAAVSTAAITAGVLTAGIGLAAGLVFVGVTAAAGGSGAVVGSKVLGRAMGKYHERRSHRSFHLILAAGTREEAARWRAAIESAIRELVAESRQETSEEEQWTAEGLDGSGGVPSSIGAVAPLTPKKNAPQNAANRGMGGGAPANRNAHATGADGGGNANDANAYQHADRTPKWAPIQGGGIALWGILGALGGGGGNLRIYREERPCRHDSRPRVIPRFRSDVGLVGQPFPPFKASIALRANSLDAFMCLMCSGRMPDGSVPAQPNSGQIASFRIIETMNDHTDVIHLVFRPLYLFPSWTAPRDFVLYRFWKYEDDGTYQVCFDSGQHRDCPRAEGYVRGEMHGVYTIAPLKKRQRKRGRGAAKSLNAGSAASGPPRGDPSNEECLLSLVVQIDPRGWVPSTSSLPFLRNQGYGDAFSVMALHQMLDVKEALDSARFVAVPTDSVAHHHDNRFSNAAPAGRRGRTPRRLPGSGGAAGRPPRGLARDAAGESARGRGGGGGNTPQQQQIYIPNLEAPESGYVTEEDEPDEATYDFKYSDRELFPTEGYRSPQPPSSSNSSRHSVRVDIDNVNGERLRHNNDSNEGSSSVATTENICTTPPPMIPEWWAEPDANSFRVRGRNYKNDRKKVNAGSSLFRLLAAEIVETDVPIMTGMCLHPKERVQLALKREAEAKSKGLDSSSDMPPFIFAVNIALPGPPNYHMMFYYAVDDMSTIDGSDGSPSSKLCQEFFFGSKDDSFRDNTFKLIPQIIEGNFMVRKAVGSTPAIMGTKIKQTYVQGERFFELLIDTGSSSVAAGVIRICNGYAKMIVVDLAFLFEADSEQTLPERVLGCVRLKNAEFGKKLRLVESVDD